MLVDQPDEQTTDGYAQDIRGQMEAKAAHDAARRIDRHQQADHRDLKGLVHQVRKQGAQSEQRQHTALHQPLRQPENESGSSRRIHEMQRKIEEVHIDEDVVRRKGERGEMRHQVLGDNQSHADKAGRQQILLDPLHLPFEQKTAIQERDGQQGVTMPQEVIKSFKMVERQSQQVQDGNQQDLPGPLHPGYPPKQQFCPEKRKDKPGSARPQP